MAPYSKDVVVPSTKIIPDDYGDDDDDSNYLLQG